MKTLAGLLLLSLCAMPALAGDTCGNCSDRCDRCGAGGACCKYCRCVPTTKKIIKPKYECECEDFCVPGKSIRTVCCDECGNKKVIYTPTCAEVRTRKKLVKGETSKEVPSQKWVVEKLCPTCACRCECFAVQEQPAPTVAATAAESESESPDDAGQSQVKLASAAAKAKAELQRVLTPWRKVD